MSNPKMFALGVLLEAYEEHQQRTRGLRPSTLEIHRECVGQFVRAVLGDDPVDVTRLRPQDVVAFLSSLQDRYCPATLGKIGTSLRSFFRYLRVEGLCDRRLEAAIPTVARWKRGALPRALSDAQYELLMAAPPRPTPCGYRDRAIVMCLATLGLRPGEVAGLHLDDIDWRRGTLHVRTRKTRRGALLPLPLEAGEAIVEYLREERPSGSERRLFLRHDGRHRGEAITAAIVTSAVIRALNRAGIDAPIAAASVFRHTVASRMLRQGARLKEIADFLGHRDLQTTTIYAKLDLPSLLDVALPYPELAS